MRAVSLGAVATATILVVGALGATPAAAAANDPFTTMTAGFTQSLFALQSNFAGGVAFAPNGDVWVDECSYSGSPLHRFSSTSTFIQNGATLASETVVPSNAGCGLTNHADGFLYSNTDSGLVQINASTGAATGVIFGSAGGALGIAPDPQSNAIIYVGSDGSLLQANPGGASSTFSSVTTGSFIDGIAFDPTGNYLFLSNRTLDVVTIIDRAGALVQNSPSIPGVPDGISFHATSPKFVVTNNNDGSMTRLDFPSNDFTQTPTTSVFASGGFRGDLTQVGPDGCIYATQDGARFPDSTTSGSNSLVKICGGFAPPPGVGNTTVTTSLSGGGTAGAQISVNPGTAVHDSATLSGVNVGTAGGSVGYAIYSDSTCTTPAGSAGTKTVTNGLVPDSDSFILSTPGTYYWQATYSGDATNSASSNVCGDEVLTVLQPRASGAFIVGNVSAGSLTSGTKVNFWGAQWWKNNKLSGGTAPASLKGFTDSTSVPACGTDWTTRPGDSASPPGTIPSQILVIVTSKAIKSGSRIRGNTVHILRVDVDPGYGPAPGKAGNGTIAGVVC